MVQGAQNYAQETRNPEDPEGPRIQVTIPHEVYLRAYKYRPVDYQNLRLVKEVLEDPKRIFWGIREHNEGGWCYTGVPSTLFIKENVEVEFRMGLYLPFILIRH